MNPSARVLAFPSRSAGSWLSPNNCTASQPKNEETLAGQGPFFHCHRHAAGRVGLYCATNPGARFEEVVVKRPPLEAYQLFGDRFLYGDMAGWDAPVNEGTAGGPSVWTVNAGILQQTSGIYTPPDDRNTLSKRGTNLVAGNASWTDIVLTARLQSGTDDTLGLLFRYTDRNNCYRFSMDSQRRYRRLVRISGGTFTLLWQNEFA